MPTRGIYLLALLATSLYAQPNRESETSSELYRLFVRDVVNVAVFSEPEVAAERRIDANGNVSLPLIGTVSIAARTAVEAEQIIRDSYVAKEIFIDPQIILTIVEYAPREVSVLGQVAGPGKQVFPPERLKLSIVELISSVGGFTRIAKSDGVRITRALPDGTEKVFTINVEQLIKGRGDEQNFLVEPGDIVFVPERVF